MSESTTAAILPNGEATTSVASPSSRAALMKAVPQAGVTSRSFLIGLLSTAFLAWFNCLMATRYNVHMIGGIQMPFGALFLLAVFTLANKGLRRLCAAGSRIPFCPAELLTIYSMMVFGALVSTPGCDNVFLVAGPSLFYFSTPENRWAYLFYEHVPSWFAPGWDGVAYKKEVIDPIYLGNVPFDRIPWHAWALMLAVWGIFLVLVYGLMFFTALLFRKQWTQREALSFPLVEVPLQMTMDADGALAPASFWTSRNMWSGLLLAAAWHSFYGLNALIPDWPVAPVNAKDGMPFIFSEYPLNVIPTFHAEIFLGAIGLAYLLTRELSFSFWAFFVMMSLSYAGVALAGYGDLLLKTSGVQGRPDFMIYQAVGGWGAMATLLVWAARAYLLRVGRLAFGSNRGDEDEPFSPRFMVFGFLFCLLGLITWSAFAGIDLAVSLTFFAIFLLTSLVLTRLVIEGGFLFPQPPFIALQVMTESMFGSALGAANLTKLSFLQPMMLVDMRTNVLPAFLHTMKFAEVLGLDRTQLRRLLLAVLVALTVTMVITVVTTIQILYSEGGLGVYTWFSYVASRSTFQSTAGVITSGSGVTMANWGWIAIGAVMVWLMVAARSRFLWFPFHPLGYLVASSYPIVRLWFPFFVGWLIKTLTMKYGGSSTYVNLRPFMIGLILGNAASMIWWTLLAFYVNGTPIVYWPA